MTEEERKRPSRWRAYLNSVRGWLFRRRKVMLFVIWAARLIWRICKALFGDDLWTFYSVRREGSHAT